MTIARTFDIPPQDRAEFAVETEACRKEVFRLLRVMKRLLANDGKIGAKIAHEAQLLGWAEVTLRKYYDRFRHSGDWRTLIDRRRFPDPLQRGCVPNEIIELFRKLVGENQRKDAPAYRELMRRYRAGVEVAPGVAWPEYDPETDGPRGCSLRNLRRKLRAFEKVAMREGLGAALSKHGPKVLTTRVDLWVGSHLMIDDLLRDFEVLLLPAGKRARIQELGILDLFSGDRFMVHRRPQFEREDGVKDSLKEKEMRYLVAAWARGVGYSPRGTEILSEGGTAVVRKELAQWLHQYSDSAISVRYPGQLGDEQAIAGYFGRGGGNPRHKPHLESVHNLLHNEAANLPAATGHDRNPPEWLHGLQAMTTQVVKWICELPLEKALLLRPAMAEYWQGLDLLAEIDWRIATRTDHELEGWVKLNHVRVEYCQDAINDVWIGPEQFAQLPQRSQEMLMQAAAAYPAFQRVRKLCPREVFVKGAQELVRMPDHVIALMFIDRDLGDDLRQKRRLNADGMFEIQHQLADPEPMFFSREVVRPDGGVLRLEERHDYQAVLNPFDSEALWIYGPGGDVIGTAPRVQRASRIAAGSMHQALGRRSHEISALLTPLRERHADAAQLVAELQEHNGAIRRGEDVSDEAKQLARRQAKRAGSLTDFISDADANPAPPKAPGSLQDFI